MVALEKKLLQCPREACDQRGDPQIPLLRHVLTEPSFNSCTFTTSYLQETYPGYCLPLQGGRESQGQAQLEEAESWKNEAGGGGEGGEGGGGSDRGEEGW